MSGYRIWYSADDKLIAASYAGYGGDEFIFDDEVYVKELSGIDTSLGLFHDNLMYGSHHNKGNLGTSIDLYSLTVCPSGNSL